jgi:hypothetical protein
MMQNIEIRVDEAISASTILAEGVVQRWFIADGALAETSAKIAEIRIEGGASLPIGDIGGCFN